MHTLDYTYACTHTCTLSCMHIVTISFVVSQLDDSMCKKWSPLFHYKPGAGQTFSQPDHILDAAQLSKVRSVLLYPSMSLDLCKCAEKDVLIHVVNL